MSAGAKNIYNIPAGQPFARTLATHLLEETKTQQEFLSDTLILLPTRRAGRVLRDAFLELNDGQALLLPRMQPIGDLDEEELSLSIAGASGSTKTLDLPPALSRVRRDIMLGKLVHKAYPQRSQEQVLGLARALGHLMDQIYTENLNMSNLEALVPEEFANHWQITLKFLEILSDAWPKILNENGMIDYADRRNRMILALADLWQARPPDHPVIAAGSTGSIPATAQLLSVIAGMERGRVILPGLDEGLQPEDWQALEETHPQWGFQQLLERMEALPEDVRSLTETQDEQARSILAREIMRPAETIEQWTELSSNKTLKTQIENAFKGLSLITCDHAYEEAEAIALALRETLEQPDKTACLITPDRNLALRVANACKRWDIEIDDSAGQSLEHTQLGAFMLLILRTVESAMAPIDLLALLKHPLCRLEIETEKLDLALRGLKPAAGFEGLRHHMRTRKRLDEKIKNEALASLEQLEEFFRPLTTLSAGKAGFKALMTAHLELAEKLAVQVSLWDGEEGRAASGFFAELFEHGAHMDALSLSDYRATLEHFMSTVTVRPAYGTHPRLQILGQLEARLIDADLVILGGLNEGTWPPDPSVDPWMSRPMRKEFGLPDLERSTGLAAHDFVQALCMKNVILTRAARMENAPSVPSRWLQRLDAVMQAASLKANEILQDTKYLHWARMLDHTEAFEPSQRPAPAPPQDKRPHRLSVTEIETWLKDPYAIYAKHVLGLRILDPFEKPVDAAERGTVLHAILERFMKEHKTNVPEDIAGTLSAIAADILNEKFDDPAVWNFWWPRFNRIAAWLAKHEIEWRKSASNIATEVKGEMQIGNAENQFTLVAVADRIDQNADGSAIIIDYKSGGQYTQKKMNSGEHPQLPLEALILNDGHFSEVPPMSPSSLQYWLLSGGNPPGKITTLDKDIEGVMAQTRQGLEILIETYDDPAMPYISLPYPDKIPRFNDYAHLERIQEWSALGDQNFDQEAA